MAPFGFSLKLPTGLCAKTQMTHAAHTKLEFKQKTWEWIQRQHSNDFGDSLYPKLDFGSKRKLQLMQNAFQTVTVHNSSVFICFHFVSTSGMWHMSLSSSRSIQNCHHIQNSSKFHRFQGLSPVMTWIASNSTIHMKTAAKLWVQNDMTWKTSQNRVKAKWECLDIQDYAQWST